MNEKESEKLANSLKVKGTFEISARDIIEFDSLLLEIKKKQEQFVTFSMDISCEWKYEMYLGYDKRVLSRKNVPGDHWSELANRIREIENQVLTYLNEGKLEDDPKVVPVFSCIAKLHIEMKDKEAQKALEDDKQMVLFTPIDIQEKRYREDMNRLIKDMKPDGKNIESVTFQEMRDGVAVGEVVELKA